MIVRSVAELLRRRAQQRPERCAFKYLLDGDEDEAQVTYGALDEQARTIAVRLREEGKPGDRCLLLYPAGLAFISAFFGCLYAAMVPVPAYPPRLNRRYARLLSIIRDSAAVAVLTEHSLLSRVQRAAGAVPDLAALNWIATETLASHSNSDWRDRGAAPEDLALLQYTSGSTSEPRGVMVSHANLLADSRMIKEVMGISEQSVIVSWLPTFHDMGLIGKVIQPVYSGAPCTHLSPAAFIQKPVRWLRAISRDRGTISGGPNFAYEHCARKIPEEALESLDLSTWEVAFNGAEPVRAETLRDFSTRFAAAGFRREAFFPCYGLAEATLLVSGGPRLQATHLLEVSAAGLERSVVETAPRGGKVRTLVGCGEVGSGETVVAVDPATCAACGADQVGEIWLAGPNVMSGYWRSEAETEAAFGSLAGDTRRFLRTGDLGFVRDGQLFITGRIKDLIVLQGANCYPQDFERSAGGCHPALRADSAAFTIERDGLDQLVIVQEVDPRWSGDLRDAAAALRRAVFEDNETAVHRVVFVQAGQVPKTSSGKVERRACKAKLLDGELEILYESAVA